MQELAPFFVLHSFLRVSFCYYWFLFLLLGYSAGVAETSTVAGVFHTDGFIGIVSAFIENCYYFIEQSHRVLVYCPIWT